MKIEINDRTKHKVDQKLIKQVINEFGRQHEIENKEISLAFIGDSEMRKLNKTFRQMDKPTDILSFAGENDFFGELILDYSQIKKQAKEFSKTAREEMIFILVHGLFHLLGYTDETEKDRLEMIRLGEEFLKKLKIKKSKLKIME